MAIINENRRKYAHVTQLHFAPFEIYFSYVCYIFVMLHLRGGMTNG